MMDKTRLQPEITSDCAPWRGDRIGVARWLGIGLSFLCLVGAGSVAAHSMMRSAKALPHALALQRAIGLSTPAWVPSGRPLRIPSGLRTGVDLRFLPQLPLAEPQAMGKNAKASRSEMKN